MEQRVCKNKQCQRPLPESWKHKYCEHCRTEHAKQLKDLGKATLGLTFAIGSFIIGKGNIKK